ncbi:MAG: PKD domain-containing protein, partial [Terriglobales bacterium]
MNFSIGTCLGSGRRFAAIGLTVMGGLWIAATAPAQAPAPQAAVPGAAAAVGGTGLTFAPPPPSYLANPFAAAAQAASAAAPADEEQYPSSRMQGSLNGNPGLWSTQFAETLAPGQASSGVYVQRYSRAPGGLVFTDAGAGWTVGITNWVEINFNTTPYRRIRLNNPNELTFGPLGTFASFNPVAPFIRNPLVTGPADWSVGLTFGLLSQDRGAPLGVALQFQENVPYWQDLRNGVNVYGTTTTEPQFLTNVLIDKWLGTGGEIAVNLGYQHNATADPGKILIPLRDQFNWDVGAIFPLQGVVQGIVEVNGNTPFGAGVNGDAFETPRPVDITAGIRVNPIPWMGLNLGYRYGAHEPRTMTTGWVFGVSFGPSPTKKAPPPPPAPPTFTCSVDQTPVQPGTAVRITSTIAPEGNYTYTWATTGGQLTQSGSSASLDTTGMAAGMYTVTGRANNGVGGTADCQASVEIRVPERHPPTATCAVTPDTVLPGAALTFSAQASSPDNRPLTYAWQLSEGQPDTTTQASVHDDTTGAAPGTVTGTLTVRDDRGLTATCSASATLQQPPPPPQAALATTLQFKPNSSR